MHVKLKLLLMKVLLLLQLTLAVSDENPPSFKIVGGVNTNIKNVPYLASVRVAKQDKRHFGKGHCCGGTLISPLLILTAAHCCFDPRTGKIRSSDDLLVVLGTTELRIKQSTTQVRDVKDIFIHSGYTSNTISNDIALLLVKRYIHPNSNIRVLPINTNDLNTREGITCTISGWGSTYSTGPIHPTLQSTAVPLLSAMECTQSYLVFTTRMLCAGTKAGGIDACQGDSGGPLECRGVLVGIVSFGKGCALPHFPGVYTNVVAYVDWIRTINSTVDYSGSRRCTLRVFPVICITVVLTILTR